MYNCTFIKASPSLCWTRQRQYLHGWCLRWRTSSLYSLLFFILLLLLFWRFCCSYIILVFVSIWIILWSLVNVSVMIICRVSWSLLLWKTCWLLYILPYALFLCKLWWRICSKLTFMCSSVCCFHLPINNWKVQASCKYDIRHWIFDFYYFFLLNSFKQLIFFSAWRSGGRYTLIITILRFCMCVSWYSTCQFDFAISSSASTASVTLMSVITAPFFLPMVRSAEIQCNS